MRLTALAPLCLVAAAALHAQTAPPSQKVAPNAQAKPSAAAKPAVTTAAPAGATAKPVAVTAKPGAAVKPATAPATGTQAKPATAQANLKPAPATAAAKPAAPAKGKEKDKKQKENASAAKAKPMPARTAAKAARPAAIKTKAVVTNATLPRSARRDPFVSPVREAAPTGAGCGIGKKCLAIDAILLRGIVRYQAGMIAVVESSGGRNVSYFLRENDPVFNGYVVKITSDSIVFRENVMDRMGRQSTRDITKKVSAPVV